ncbi:MAG TPA: biotin-dependent carboxyltransferase family protein [Vicinamibacterales bacterium]|nr:biotin-dependent carboxyltransferase family protein [Vicinamibacterales bacterium]
MPRLIVIRPGMLTTIQDLGRWGHQASGVPVAGPMDVYSHRRANRLVGNRDDAAALEVTLIGPELEADADVVCAVTGAEFQIDAGGTPIVRDEPFTVPAGARLRFGRRLAGARASLAVRGGLDVPCVFGSCATSLISGMGPLGGRALRAGDVLMTGAAPTDAPDRAGESAPLRLPQGGARLRVMPGPHRHMFTTEAYDRLFGSRYTVTPDSNRMGYRLAGPALTHAAGADILSDATPIGSLQVPGSGLPILLMADRQTTGGYPKIGTVITADLPLAGQLAPGDWIEFAACSRQAAIDALAQQERALERARR